jgi:hypothetical protein
MEEGEQASGGALHLVHARILPFAEEYDTHRVSEALKFVDS